MRCFKRAFLSLKYQYKAYLVLFMGFFTIAFVLFISLGLAEDVGSLSKNLRIKYGGTIDIFPLSGTNFRTVKDAAWLPGEDLAKIRSIPEVEKLYCRKDIMARAVNFQACDIAEKEGDEADVILYGMDRPEGFTSFRTGEYKLEAGTLDVGGKNALVPQLLAHENGWTVGSAIEVQEMETGKTGTFKVSGIFSCENLYVVPNYANPVNGIITSAESVVDLSQDATYMLCSVQVHDPSMVPDVIEKIKALDLTIGSNLGLENASIDYLTAQQPLNGIGVMMEVIAVGVFILGIIVLLIYTYNILSSRTLEIGILFALGEKKRFILGQLAIELFIVIVFAYLTSLCIADQVMPIFGSLFLPLEDIAIKNVLVISLKVKGILIAIFLFVELILMLVPIYLMQKKKPKEILSRSE